MKLNRTGLFIAISSTALLIVLIIQVGWIIQTAQIKEDFFNEKANMVLSRTTEAIRADKQACTRIQACGEVAGDSEPAAQLGKDEVHKIDSLFRYYMRLYNFHIDYSFVVAKPELTAGNEKGFANYIYNKPLEDVPGNGVELKLIFPEKKQFIMAEMSTTFIASVILILIVLVMFWRTVRSLLKEKMISEHTTDFLNNMTHEFKTPLTNIALAGRMIMKDAEAGQEDKTRHYSAIILEENEKLRLQVEQVLNMTALERGEIPLQKQALNFHEMITDALKCMNIQIENKKGIVNLYCEADNFVITGDKTHLTNALCNLIDNAIKYSAGKPELTVRTANQDHNLIVTVSDKGIGIEKEYRQKVFDKYFRVPTGNVHDVKGFGLGLAYIKKIIELHGGSIMLESDKSEGMSRDAGTSFIITLPYV